MDYYYDTKTMIVAMKNENGICCCTDSKTQSVLVPGRVHYRDGGKYITYGKYVMMFAGSGYRLVDLNTHLRTVKPQGLLQLARDSHKFLRNQNLTDKDVAAGNLHLRVIFCGFENGEHKIYDVNSENESLVDTDFVMGGSGSNCVYFRDVIVPVDDMQSLSEEEARKKCLIAVHMAALRDDEHCGGDKWLYRINGENVHGPERVAEHEHSYMGGAAINDDDSDDAE